MFCLFYLHFLFYIFFFFFSSRRRHTRYIGDWSSDVCSSDLLKQPVVNRDVLAKPLERIALAYLTQVHQNGRLYDPVATFHLSNGARLERIHAFGNLRPYGLQASFGLTANYLYVPYERKENHES